MVDMRVQLTFQPQLHHRLPLRALPASETPFPELTDPVVTECLFLFGHGPHPIRRLSERPSFHINIIGAYVVTVNSLMYQFGRHFPALALCHALHYTMPYE